MIRHPLLVRTVAVLLVPGVSGCTSWRVETRPLPDLVSGAGVAKPVAITLVNGRRYEVSRPTVSGDSLRGIVFAFHENRDTLARFALRDIRQVSTPYINETKTLFAILGVAAVLAGLLYIAWSSSPFFSLGGGG